QCLSFDWHLCGADSQGRKAQRSTGSAGCESRIRDQSQDGQDAWSHLSAAAARPRRRGDRVNRREFITLLGGAAAWPLAARAQPQPGKVWRVGWLAAVDVPAFRAAFVQGMQELGYVEGKNFVIELRSAEANYEQIPKVAAELMRLKVDVIVTAMSTALPI